MTRTLVVTNDFPPRRGGIESFVYSLCTAMPDGEVVVYTARMRGAPAVDERVGFRVIRDRRGTLLPTRRVARAVARVALDHRCDRVLFGAAAPLGLLARGLKRRTAITHATGLTHGHEVWWAAVPGARRLLRRIGDDLDVITYVSEYCRARIAAALSPEAVARMRPCRPAVDPIRFRSGLDGAAWRVRLGITPLQPLVLSASRLARRKGQDVLVRAWPEVLSVRPEAVLVIVGDGPSRHRLRRLVASVGVQESVRMVPGVGWDEMPAVYAMADVFALPCRTRLWGLEPEAFGIVFLEAAACGVPILAGDSGGAPEAAVGVGGAVVEGRNVRAVARQLTAML